MACFLQAQDVSCARRRDICVPISDVLDQLIPLSGLCSVLSVEWCAGVRTSEVLA